MNVSIWIMILLLMFVIIIKSFKWEKILISSNKSSNKRLTAFVEKWIWKFHVLLRFLLFSIWFWLVLGILLIQNMLIWFVNYIFFWQKQYWPMPLWNYTLQNWNNFFFQVMLDYNLRFIIWKATVFLITSNDRSSYQIFFVADFKTNIFNQIFFKFWYPTMLILIRCRRLYEPLRSSPKITVCSCRVIFHQTIVKIWWISSNMTVYSISICWK